MTSRFDTVLDFDLLYGGGIRMQYYAFCGTVFAVFAALRYLRYLWITADAVLRYLRYLRHFRYYQCLWYLR